MDITGLLSSYHHLVWLVLIGIIVNTLYFLPLVNNIMKFKSSSFKKKRPFISYFPSSSQNIPPQKDFWYDDIPDTSNDSTASIWCANPIAEKLSMAVDSQSTIKILRTSKSSSGTVNNMPLLQPLFHSARINVVNITLSHSPHIQTVENDMSAANEPAVSNTSVP